jgi:hypothetical protein
MYDNSTYLHYNFVLPDASYYIMTFAKISIVSFLFKPNRSGKFVGVVSGQGWFMT